MKQKRPKTLTSKVVIAWMAVLAVSNIIIGVISYSMYKNQFLQAGAAEAQDTAVAVALRIDGDKFSEVMETLEKNEYWHEVKEYLDKIVEVFGATYIYVLDKHYTDEVLYFAEGSSVDEPYDLGDTETIEGVYAGEMFVTLETGNPTHTAPYSSGEYGDMVSGFAAITNSRGEIAGVVGTDFSYGNLKAEMRSFALTLVAVIAAFLAGCYFVMMYLGTKLAGKPLSELDEAARKLSTGDMEVTLNIASTTEIGRLAKSFTRMIDTMKEQVAALEVLSHGDLTPHIVPRSEKDTMGIAIAQILSNLNEMFSEIHRSAAMVSSGARQISDNAQTMAHGASEQADAVARLHESVTDMTAKAKENLEVAVKTNNLTDAIKADAQTGSEHMNKMTLAVREITEASKSISKVIKVIDDIAFQTNILALNAAVEAARAGQHGKGFAVVAEEVRNLAAKSAEAAKDTERLISNSMEKAQLGASIADETAGSLDRIIQGVNECASLMSGIAGAFEKQIDAMEQVDNGIEQVSHVVTQNREIAKESAAASEEMSNQSEVLEDLVSHFKLRGDVSGSSKHHIPKMPNYEPASITSSFDYNTEGKY